MGITWEFEALKRKRNIISKNKTEANIGCGVNAPRIVQHTRMHICFVYNYIDFNLICSDHKRLWMRQLKQEVFLSFMVGCACDLG